MFSKPAFGQTNPPAFGGFASPGTSNTAGTSTPFGQNTFNKPATSTTGFPAPSFGGGGSTMFGGGQAAPGAGMFGNTAAPAFGQPAQQTQPGFSGFNAGTSTPLFGANSGVSSFAQPKPTFGGFGTNTSSSGLFGAQPTVSGTTAGQPGSSLFNQGSNLFGSGFGTPGATGGAATLGTPIKFNAPTGTDSMAKNGITQTINTRHQCITCMKEYENKSLEELRLEDLQAGRKGPTGGDGMFGATGAAQPGQNSLFGAPTLSQPGTSGTGFGENKPLFGATATTSSGLGAFGSTAPAFGTTQTSGGLFGKPTGFGGGTTTTASGFSFNNNNNNNAASANPFGAANQQKPFGAAPTTTLFGAQQNTGTMFGAQANTGFTGFGTQQPQQQGIGLFGQNKPASPFGLGAQQQPAVSTGFGFAQNTVNNTQAGCIFGAKPQMGTGIGATAFGANNMFGPKPAGTATTPVFGGATFGGTANTGIGGATNLFGQQQFNKPGTQAPAFGFGQQQPGTATALGGATGIGNTGGLFGNTLGKPATQGIFGSSGGTLFGTNTNTAQNAPFNLGTSMTFNSQGAAGLSLGQNSSLNFNSKPMFSGMSNPMGMQSTAATEDPHKRMLALCAYPYGDRALFRNLPGDFSKLDEMRLKTTSPAMQKATLNQSPAYNISTSKPKLPVSPLVSTPAKKSMFDGLDTAPSIIGSTISITPSFNIRRLNLRSKVTKATDQSETPEQSRTLNLNRRPMPIAAWLNEVPEVSPSADRVNNNTVDTPKTTKEVNAEVETTVSDIGAARCLTMDEPTTLNDSNASVSITFSDTSENKSHEEIVENDTTREAHPAGIILTRTDYYTIPSLAELAKITDENGRCIVQNFTIGRLNYGNIFFEDSFDVSGLNLDALVHIRHKEVVVHPDDESKPPLGEGLNRRAQVTLDRVYPVNKQTRQPITDPETMTELKYEDHLRNTCLKMKVRFLEYRPDSGSWVFKVDHFSKYGIDEDAENEENTAPAASAAPTAPAGVKKIRTEPIKPPPQKAQQKQQPLQPAQQQLPVTPQTHKIPEAEAMDEGFPEAQSPTDQLSRLAGTDTSKMRLMKASLFAREGDTQNIDSEAVEESRSEMHQRLTISMYHSQPPIVGYASSYDPEPVMQVEEESEETQQLRPYQRPSLVTPCHQVLPVQQPVSNNKYIPDAGLFLSHHFTSSWGIGSKLLLSHGFSISVHCPYKQTSTFKEWVQCHLTVQLRHTSTHDDGGMVPRRGARTGLEALEDHCETLELRVDHDEREKIIRQVLHLCLALWGDLKSLSEDSKPSLVAHERRHAVSEWLQKVISEEEDEEEDTRTYNIGKVVKHLTKGNLLDSVQCSQEMGDHYSAMVLATAGSAVYPRQLVQRQLQEWVGGNISTLVNTQRLRAWLLSGAGLPLLALEDGETLNALQGLDWIYCLAAHFWYLSSSAASIPDVLTRYEEAFTGQHSYAAAPVPAGGTEKNLDLRFHLLKLFSQRTHPLEQLLSVETHFPDSPLDFSLGWLLLELLDALNYTHVSEHCSQGLHLAFAEQLEAAGLWEWAIFVLQHITEPAMRSSAVEKILGRHITLDTTTWSSPDDLQPIEEFIVSKLGVPAKMVFEAKAHLAACRQKYSETACYQLHAEDWSGCHNTIVNHLASDAIINEDSTLLMRLLRALRPHGHQIDGWENQGQVFLNYLGLLEDVRGLNPVGIVEPGLRGAANLEAMHQRVSALLSQLSRLPCRTPKERLCQSEIARRTVAVARSLLVSSGETSTGSKFTDVLNTVPMPDDYRLQELRQASKLIIQDM